MSKTKELYNRIHNRPQPKSQGESILHRNTAEALVEAQLSLLILSAHQILVSDFNLTAEQLQKFQELWFAQTEINRLHRR